MPDTHFALKPIPSLAWKHISSKLVPLVAVLGLLFTTGQTAVAQTFTVLYSFNGGGGGNLPDSGLILDAEGNLYGETEQGGAHYNGTVFRLTPGGTETVLYNFSPGWSAQPGGGLVRNAKGNLYGTDSGGYPRYSGAVFELLAKGKKLVLKPLYRFSEQDRASGATPSSGPLVMDAKGNLYGTTYYGGNPSCYDGINYGCGVVFEITASGTEKVLYAFSGGTDGANPQGGVIFDAEGNLYGTASQGGYSPNCPWPSIGCGTVFKLTPHGSLTVLHSFSGQGPDGAKPQGGVIFDAEGNLYGTTLFGGGIQDQRNCNVVWFCGTVFKLTPDGTESLLHSFGAVGDGALPQAGLVMDSQGNLYGTTPDGGAYGLDGGGTVFELTPSGTETVLHSFCSQPHCTDGRGPTSPLVLDALGNLYGTTQGGGAYSEGTVFELTP